MTEIEAEIYNEWQLYNSLVENAGLKPTLEGFLNFRCTTWTKETATEEGVIKRAKQCEETGL